MTSVKNKTSVTFKTLNLHSKYENLSVVGLGMGIV